MTNEELNTKLYEKLYAEQEDFKGWLLKQPPEEILKHAYEYVIREDIVIEMEFHDLTDDEARALLADEKPLQSIYNIYEDLEGGHMDEIRDCIESRAKTCIEEQREALRNLPVYVFSATFAKEHGELEAYRASFRANVDCKNAIEESISKLYMDEHGFDYDTMAARKAELAAKEKELSAKITEAQNRIAEVNVLKTQIINYSKTRDVYVAYRKSGYSKKFLEEHEDDIIVHRAAKKAFDELGVKKLPTVKSLQVEFAEQLTAKKEAYAELKKVRDELRDVAVHTANYEELRDLAERDPRKEKEHGR